MSHEGLVRSGIRSFLKAFCFLIGIALAVFFIIISASLISTQRPESLKYAHPTALSTGTGKIAIPSPLKDTLVAIPIVGFIGDRKLQASDIEMQLISALHYVQKKENIKAVILNINSGGGFAFSSQQIYSTLKHYSHLIDCPIYASVDGIAASGAYLISCASDKIYSTDYSIIGSVGSKFSDFFNLTDLMTSVGVQAKALHAGKNKDPLNPFVPWVEGSDSHLQSILESDYQLFVDIVCKNRPKITKELLTKTYGANIFSTEDSVSYGFVDESVRSSFDMLKMVKQELNLNDDFQILEFSQVSFMESLIETFTSISLQNLFKLQDSKQTLYHYSP